jgi:hypothetical protein
MFLEPINVSLNIFLWNLALCSELKLLCVLRSHDECIEVVALHVSKHLDCELYRIPIE